MTNAEKFVHLFGLYATDLWSESEKDFLVWLNAEYENVPDTNVGELISRQAAIDAIHKDYDAILDFKSDGHTVADSFEDIINALPSVLPRKGKWIWDGDSADWGKEYICRECKCYALEKDGKQIRSNFCHNCGVDMKDKYDEQFI